MTGESYHIGIEVSDYQAAVYFYRSALSPLGYELLMEVEGFVGFGMKETGGPWYVLCKVFV